MNLNGTAGTTAGKESAGASQETIDTIAKRYIILAAPDRQTAEDLLVWWENE